MGTMIRGKKFVSLCIFIILLTPSISSRETSAKESYSIEGYSVLTIDFSEELGSIFIIEVDNSISGKTYSVRIRDQYNTLVASRENYTKNSFFAFIGTGAYNLTIENPNSQIVEIALNIESYNLVVNNEIGGYSYKNKIFCWNFISGTNYTVLSIDTIKRGHYNLYFSSAEKDISANLWFSYYQPSQDPDWNEYLDSLPIIKNDKKLIDLENQELWLVVDVSSLGSHDITIVLRSTIVGRIWIIVIGIAAAVIGVIIFVLYYLDPLKYRKRKVSGTKYESVKHEFEQPEDLGETMSELITKTKKKK